MGAWGHGNFDNDGAGDWVAFELRETDDLSAIESAFAVVLDEEEYLDSVPAEMALAACETLARLRGNFGVRSESTEFVDQWVETHSHLNADPLLATAIRVLDRIVAENSELRELWRETDSFDDWQTTIDDLRARLQ